MNKNYEAIKAPLQALGITYNHEEIKKKVPGSAAKLLFAIKLKLEGTVNPHQTQKAGAKKAEIHGEKTKTVLAKDIANQQLMTKLEKFQDAKKQLYEKAQKSIEEEKRQNAETIKKRIETHNNTMRENKEFMKNWTQQGLKNWYTNQQKANERIEKHQAFEETAINKYKTSIQKSKEFGAKEVREGIDTFERNLQKLGIDIQEQVIDEEEDNGSGQGKGKKKRQPFSIVSAMTKIREKKTLADFARKEKDRRRRKTQVDQARTQTEIEKQYKEAEMLRRLQIDAAKMRADCYQKWREGECKILINSLAKEAELQRQKKTKQQMTEFIKEKEIENLELKKRKKTELIENRKKFAKAEREKKEKTRALTSKVMQQTIITQLLDLANEAYKKQLGSETKQIDSKAWDDWMKAFMNGEDIAPAGVSAYVTHTKTSWNKDSAMILDPELEKYDMVDYTMSLGLWNPQLVIEDAQKVLAEYGDSDTPLQINPDIDGLSVPNSLIWKWYEEVKQFMNKPQEMAKKKEETMIGYVPVKMILNGKRFTPKKEIIKALEEKYGVKVLKPFSEIKKIAAEIAAEKKALEEKKEEKKEGKKEDAKGKPAKPSKQEAPKKEDSKNQNLKKIVEQIIKLRGESMETEAKELNQLYVTFVIEWIKETYPKSMAEYRGELKKRLKRVKEINVELQGMQDDGQAKKGAKANPKKEQELNAELEELNKPGEKGFIIVGFPKNVEQSQLLQEALTGKKCNFEQKVDSETKTAKLLSGIIVPPEKIEWEVQSGLDGYVLIDISKAECKKRASCRKKDPDTGISHYAHYEFPADPAEQAKLVDAALPKDQQERIYWRLVASDKELIGVEDYYSRFKAIESGYGQATIWNRISGIKPVAEIINEVAELVEKRIIIYKESESNIVEEIERELATEEKKVEEEKKPEVAEVKKEEDKKEIEKEPVTPEKKGAKDYLEEGIKEAWGKMKEKYIDSMNIIFKFYRKQKYIKRIIIIIGLFLSLLLLKCTNNSLLFWKDQMKNKY